MANNSSTSTSLTKNERRLLQEKDEVFGLLRPIKTTSPTQLPSNNDVGKAVAYQKGKEDMIRSRFTEKKNWLQK